MHHITCCSDDITALAGAMLAVQAGLAPALKDADNPFTRSRYATLNSVMEACRDSSRDIIVWFMEPSDPLYVFGPTGSGKTSCIMQLAARLG